MKLPLFILTLGVFAWSALPAFSQRLFTKDGKELPWADCVIQGSNVAWKTKDALGKDRIINILGTDIVRIDYPEPVELQDAAAAATRGDGDTALTKADVVLKQFEGFKLTAGSWWVSAALVKLEALGIKKDEAGFDKLNAELKAMTLGPSDQLRLRAAQGAQEYYKGAPGPAKQIVEEIIPKTDDAAVLAKLYLLLGDIEYKRQSFADAREAYLHVPVFYGSQGLLLPNAELGAARSLVKLQRLEDASEMLSGIVDRYPGTPQAKAADEERKQLLKALGETEQSMAEKQGNADAKEKPEGETPAEEEKK
ncbi:MAG: hypothetical protein KA004_01390 [Verrucomicrobiales bacterium]|nr:hypothetical protein [Verrucomicrobiales bacterium]